MRDDDGTVHSLPETGTIKGELVATNLGRWGSPLIRYRTGDRVEYVDDRVLCRRKGGRLEHSGYNQQKVSHGHREIHRQ